MKIALYTSKGGAGKTPVAVQIAADFEYAVGTNESYDVYSEHLSDERLLFTSIDEAFPDLDDVDIVFDLAGSMNERDHSVLSAIKQSDVVLVPIWNYSASIKAGLKSLREVAQINPRLIVVATKLTKKPKQDWIDSDDYVAVESNVKALASELKIDIPVMPLRESDVFKRVVEEFQSIHQISNSYTLGQHNNRELLAQIDALYSKIGEYA